MGIKLKNGVVKKAKNKVKLDIGNIKVDLTLEEITKIEISNMLNRLQFMAGKHGLSPVIENIKISYEQLKKEQ